jgi:hypothetical protein
MVRRFAFASLAHLGLAGVALLAGCGSDGQQNPDGASHDADFSVCMDTPAVVYMPGMNVTSTSGAYVATLESAVADLTPPINGPQVGFNTWVVALTNAADGTPADVTVMAERPTMPIHGHGAATYPVVTAGDPGTVTLSKIDFFQAGYWEQKLDLQPTAGGAVDNAAFAICVPR